MHEVAAIVVTYNRKRMLLECLNALLSQSEAQCDIIIIDNASTDGTYEEIGPIIDETGIKYFNTGENIGGAGGFNYGLRKAYDMGYQYFWLMDDDTFPEKDALKELLKANEMLNREYGFLSSAVYWKDGSLCNMNIQRLSLQKKISGEETDNTKIIMASFVSFFLKKSTLEKYGLPIKDFFIWSDDLEYSRRISRSEPGYYIPQSKVLHAMNSNEKVGIEKDGKERLWRYEYLYRNEVYVYRREGLRGCFFLLLRMILHSSRILFNQGEEKPKKLQLIWRSFYCGIRFNPKVEYI